MTILLQNNTEQYNHFCNNTVKMQNGVKTIPLQAFTKTAPKFLSNTEVIKKQVGKPGTPQQKTKTQKTDSENTRDLSLCEER